MQNKVDAIVLCGERQFTLPGTLDHYSTLDDLLNSALRTIPDRLKPVRFDINFSIHCIFSDSRLGTIALVLQNNTDFIMIKDAYTHSGRAHFLFTLEKPEGIAFRPASEFFSFAIPDEERYVPIFHKQPSEQSPSHKTSYTKTLMSAPLVEFEKLFQDRYDEEVSNKLCDFVLLHKGGIEDGATLQPGGEFSKTWMISKSGETWGDAVIQCVNGDYIGSKYEIPPIDAHGATRIILNLQAPQKIGWSSSFWRVMVNGEPVGPSLWIEFEVREAVVQDVVLEEFVDKLTRDHIEDSTLNQLMELYKAGCNDTEKLYNLWKQYGRYSDAIEVISSYYFAD
jgi:hypothetical protein